MTHSYTCIRCSKCRAFNSQYTNHRERARCSVSHTYAQVDEKKKRKKNLYWYTYIESERHSGMDGFGVFFFLFGCKPKSILNQQERENTQRDTAVARVRREQEEKKERTKTTATTIPSIRLDSVQYTHYVLSTFGLYAVRIFHSTSYTISMGY